MAELSGLRALVTGAASGIGLATADALMAAGATVAVLDRVSPIFRPDAPTHRLVVGDVTDDDEVRAAVQAAIIGRGDIGQPLADQLLVGVVLAAGHAVGHGGRQQRRRMVARL